MPEWAGFVLAFVGAVLLYWGARLVLGKTERRRVERLTQWRDFESIKSETPLDDPRTVAQERAIESVQSHYHNTRKLLFPAFLVMALVLAGIPLLGQVPATLLSFIIGAVTVVVGIAAKPVVENFIAGLVIGFSKVLNIGDIVMVEGHYSTVEEISMTHTTLKIWDWRRYVVPNTQMLQKEFLNFTLTDHYQWAYIEFWVDYETDLEKLRTVCDEIPRASRYFAPYEDPAMWVMDTTKEGIRIWLAAWANSPADAWMLKADMRTELACRLRTLGLKTHRHELSFVTAPEGGTPTRPA